MEDLNQLKRLTKLEVVWRASYIIGYELNLTLLTSNFMLAIERSRYFKIP